MNKNCENGIDKCICAKFTVVCLGVLLKMTIEERKKYLECDDLEL